MLITEMSTVLKYVNISPNKDPEYADGGSSGFDLRAWITDGEEGVEIEKLRLPYETKDVKCVTLKPLERRMFHTGLFFDIAPSNEIQVRPRSGLALKEGITVCNSPGSVDESYTGEVCVILINLSNNDVKICDGDRIAQAVIAPVFTGENVELKKVDKIEKETERGAGGFGHTGVK